MKKILFSLFLLLIVSNIYAQRVYNSDLCVYSSGEEFKTDTQIKVYDSKRGVDSIVILNVNGDRRVYKHLSLVNFGNKNVIISKIGASVKFNIEPFFMECFFYSGVRSSDNTDVWDYSMKYYFKQ